MNAMDFYEMYISCNVQIYIFENSDTFGFYS
jgi:hypothetical protein